jgi:2-dehydro-3-deoxygluconokinase
MCPFEAGEVHGVVSAGGLAEPRITQYDVVSFGETMVRLAAPLGVRLENADHLELTVGGSESNVAIALARLGRRTAWISGLVKNPLGRRIDRELRAGGVDTSHVHWRGDGRVGTYFLEPGIGPRPTRVYYDRAGSAVTQLDPDAIGTGIVAASRVLHLTGITPALAASCATVCERLADAARISDVPLVFDVNYRAQLWTPESAKKVIARFIEAAEIVLCGAADAALLWGFRGDPHDVSRRLLELTDADIVVVTIGERGAVARTRGGQEVAQSAVTLQAVDPVGAGDAFAAGFLHSWLDEPADAARALRYATAMAALKMTVRGDHAQVELDELLDVVERDATLGGDIIR